MHYEVYDGPEYLEKLGSLNEAIDFAKSYASSGHSDDPNMSISLYLLSHDEIQQVSKADTRSVGICLESLIVKIKSFLRK